MKTFRNLLLVLTFIAAGPALADQYRCTLTHPSGPVNPDIVYVEAEQLQEFLEVMRSQGIKAKCSRVQDA